MQAQYKTTPNSWTHINTLEPQANSQMQHTPSTVPVKHTVNSKQPETQVYKITHTRISTHNSSTASQRATGASYRKQAHTLQNYSKRLYMSV